MRNPISGNTAEMSSVQTSFFFSLFPQASEQSLDQSAVPKIKPQKKS